MLYVGQTVRLLLQWGKKALSPGKFGCSHLQHKYWFCGSKPKLWGPFRWCQMEDYGRNQSLTQCQLAPVLEIIQWDATNVRLLQSYLAMASSLQGQEIFFYVKRRGCIRTTHENVSLKRAKVGCHQREPSPHWNFKKTQQKDNVSVRISAALCPTYKDHRPYFLAQSAAWKIRVLYLHWED